MMLIHRQISLAVDGGSGEDEIHLGFRTGGDEVRVRYVVEYFSALYRLPAANAARWITASHPLEDSGDLLII